MASVAPMVGFVIAGSILATGQASARECGAFASTVTCTTATYTTGPNDDISYLNAAGLSLIINDAALDVNTQGTAVIVRGQVGATQNVMIDAQNFGEINTTQPGGRGLLAGQRGTGAATVSVNNGTITTLGSGGYGAQAVTVNTASTAAVMVTMGGSQTRIRTLGLNAHGLYALNQGLGDAVITLSDGLLNIKNGHGAFARIDNALSTGSAEVAMHAGEVKGIRVNYRRGLYAQNAGLGTASVVLSGGKVGTHGIGTHGVEAQVTNTASSAAATVTMSGGAVTTTGEGADGLSAVNLGLGDATTTLIGGDVETNGDFSFGAASLVSNTLSAAASETTIDNTDVLTRGNEASGLYAVNLGMGTAAVTMTSGNVTTFGDEAFGLSARIGNTTSAADVTIEMADGAVITNGMNSDGLRAETSGTGRARIDVRGGTVTSGTGASAGIRTIAAAGSTVNIASGVVIDSSASNVAIRDGDADLDGIDENGGDIVVTTAGTVTGDALLGDGNDVFNLTDGIFTGDIQADDAVAAGNDDFNWSAGTLNGGFYGGNGTDTAVVDTGAVFSANTILDGGDDLAATDGWVDSLTFSNVTTSVKGANVRNWETVTIDGGRISITDATLAVGSLTIQGAGAVDGGAALALTGNLTIDNGSSFIGSGTSAGVYTFSGSLVNNGTIMLQDGFAGDSVAISGDYSGTGALHVDLDASTDSVDAFTISGSYSGPTSLSVNSLSGNATGHDITVITAGSGSSVNNFTLSGGTLSLGAFDYTLANNSNNDLVLRGAFNSTGATYEAAPVVMSGFNTLTSLRQRIAQRQWGAANEGLNGSWLRVAGNRTDVTTSSGTDIERNQFTTQVGVDYAINPSAAGQWVLGATAQYGKVSGHTAAMLGTGNIDAEGFGIGATATWYGTQGVYVDIQGQLNSVSTDYASSAGGLRAEGIHSRTYALSVETGKRIALDANRTIIPQAQLTWGTVDGGTFIDDFGTSVDLGHNESLIARVGLSYEFKDSSVISGRAASYYVTGNLLHDFSAGNRVSVGGAEFTSETGESWGEIGMGVSVALSEGTKFYGESSYRREFGGNGRGLGLSAGLNFQW